MGYVFKCLCLSLIMKYLIELKRLKLPKDMFAIFGSGPLAIRNLRENRDLDIIVKSELWDKLKDMHPLKKKDVIKIGNIEVYKDWKPCFNDVDELIDNADIIEGLRFVNLKSVLKWKKFRNLEKDKKDIGLIEDYENQY